eukprot:scaffold254430_cov31-Tisochrysis_lutea.AAC.2
MRRHHSSSHADGGRAWLSYQKEAERGQAEINWEAQGLRRGQISGWRRLGRLRGNKCRGGHDATNGRAHKRAAAAKAGASQKSLSPLGDAMTAAWIYGASGIHRRHRTHLWARVTSCSRAQANYWVILCMARKPPEAGARTQLDHTAWTHRRTWRSRSRCGTRAYDQPSLVTAVGSSLQPSVRKPVCVRLERSRRTHRRSPG